MIRDELITTVLESLGSDTSRVRAEQAVRAVLEGISNGLRTDGAVQIAGFGTFTVKVRKARTGRNPQTGEPIQIPETVTVRFKPGTRLKEHL